MARYSDVLLDIQLHIGDFGRYCCGGISLGAVMSYPGTDRSALTSILAALAVSAMVYWELGTGRLFPS